MIRFVTFQLRRAACLMSLVAIGCSGTPEEPVPSLKNASVANTQIGEFAPRAEAMSAFAGNRGPILLTMALTTVEGKPISLSLNLSKGQAVLVIDETADGGGVRSQVLTSLEFVRRIPARWVNNVEIEKERFEAVGTIPGTPTERVYYLVHPSCLTGPCTATF